MITRLITGGTGFIGSNLVKRLLEKGNSRLILLARSSENSLAEERVRKFFGEYDLRNLEVIEGDIKEADLGLDSERVRRLEKDVNEIWHLAGSTDMRGSQLDETMNTNHAGTVNVLEFAKRIETLELFAYTSTAYVAGKSTGKVLEDEIHTGQEFNNPYEKSKFLAEMAVREYIRGGLKAIIFRPSVIVGNSKTGETQNFKMVYGPWLGIQMVKEIHLRQNEPEYENGKIKIPFRVVGNDDATLNIIPIDSVVDMMVSISKNKSNISKTFHLTNPDYTTIGFLREQICKHLGITGVSYVPHITNGSIMERFYARRTEVYVPYMLFDDPRFERSNTSKALPHFNIPKPTEELMKTLIGYCIDVNWTIKKN